MRSSRRSLRGYVSFLFMAPLALLLLMPLTLQRGAEDSLVSVYPADSALAEQVALKRAMLRAAHTAILEAKNNITDALESSAIVFGVPEAKIADVALEVLSEDQKLQAVRFSVLRHWSRVLRQWNQHSDYTVRLDCGPPVNLGASIEFDYNHVTDAGASLLSYSPSWQACSQFIRRGPQLTSLQRPYIITPGFKIRVEHRFFNTSGASQVRPQEVGS